MPELPEVETVRRGLQPALEGARLARVRALRPDLRFPLPPRFSARLEGARVLSLARRAKYLLAELDTGETLVMHLGMTGRFEVEGAGAPGGFHRRIELDDRHVHVVFETEEGSVVRYCDPRRFGFMDVLPTEGIGEARWFKGMGPEPLGNAFGAETLERAFRGRRQGPKTLLLDQRVVAGLGNIYVCEALHRAGISPLRPAAEVDAAGAARLAGAVREVLAEAVEAGGSTLRDFAAADGALGYFQHAFRVYDQAGRPCPREGCGGRVARIVQAGRSTFYCEACQA